MLHMTFFTTVDDIYTSLIRRYLQKVFYSYKVITK